MSAWHGCRGRERRVSKGGLLIKELKLAPAATPVPLHCLVDIGLADVLLEVTVELPRFLRRVMVEDAEIDIHIGSIRLGFGLFCEPAADGLCGNLEGKALQAAEDARRDQRKGDRGGTELPCQIERAHAAARKKLPLP